MNKKIFALLLVMLLALAVFAACGDKPEETTAAPETTEAPPETVDPNHEHVWVPDEENSKAATCLMTGKSAYKCSVANCTETKVDKLDRLEHVPDGAATCIKESKCTLCEKVLEKITDHTYGEPTVVAATCTAEGSSTETCTVCGNQRVKTLPIVHQFVETPDVTGTYVNKVCSLCGFSETTVDFTTILMYDFETDMSADDYFATAEGFTRGHVQSSGVGNIVAEGDTQNHYLNVSNAIHILDENLTLIKTDKYIIEYDIMFDSLPNGDNKSIFTILPNWQNKTHPGEHISWLWIMKVNSTDPESGISDTVGEFVSYKNGAGDKLNTDVVFAPGVWYHVTFICDWVSGTTQIFVGERGSDYIYVNTGAYTLQDSINGISEEPDGVPDITRDEVFTSAFRFCDGGIKANFDNLHIYTADKPIWDMAQ